MRQRAIVIGGAVKAKLLHAFAQCTSSRSKVRLDKVTVALISRDGVHKPTGVRALIRNKNYYPVLPRLGKIPALINFRVWPMSRSNERLDSTLAAALRYLIGVDDEEHAYAMVG